MYPNPELNSFLKGFDGHVSKKIIDRAIVKAMPEKSYADKFKPFATRLASTQPQCFAPYVDVTRAKCAFGPYALPKLGRELSSDDPLTVRQAVTTLGDLLVDSEKMAEAIKLNIPDRLADLLTSDDLYLRERVAMIYVTIANQAAGREAILKNLTAIANLSKSLDDSPAAVRLQIARALEALVRDYRAADLLCACGFVESLTAKLCSEKKAILVVYLETLKFLLYRNVKAKAVESGTFEKLRMLLDRDDEDILSNALSCLGILCEDVKGKLKAIEMDLLFHLQKLLKDKRASVTVEAARLASFITITTPGKLRVLELRMMCTLLRLASKKCPEPPESLLLAIIKTLTNVAEAAEGRKMLSEQYITLIEGIHVCKSEVLQRHKQTLLDVVRWRP